MTDTAASALQRFREARATLINEFRAEGKSFDEIARELSCDAGQAASIFSFCGPGGIYETDGVTLKGKAQP